MKGSFTEYWEGSGIAVKWKDSQCAPQEKVTIDTRPSSIEPAADSVELPPPPEPTPSPTYIKSDKGFWLTCVDGQTTRHKESAMIELFSAQKCTFRQGMNSVLIALQPGQNVYCSQAADKSIKCKNVEAE
jgi:hypothetical protein